MRKKRTYVKANGKRIRALRRGCGLLLAAACLAAGIGRAQNRQTVLEAFKEDEPCSKAEEAINGKVERVFSETENQGRNAPGSTSRRPEELLVVLTLLPEEIEEASPVWQTARLAGERLQEKGYQVEIRAKGEGKGVGDLLVELCPSSQEQEAALLTGRQGAENGAARRLNRLLGKYVEQSTGKGPGALTAEALQDPACREQAAAGISAGVDLFFHPKTMYLTFDDGPSREHTGRILDVLKKWDVPATFFLVGENVRRYPEVARRIVKEGHTVGIHCERHEYEGLYASADSYLEDFEEARRTVKEITGVDARLFRFPGGSINAYNQEVYEEIIRRMEEQGYRYHDWNASLEDAAARAEPKVLIENAVSSALGRKKVVMLAHDVIEETADCLEELLFCFPEYRMEALGEEVKPVQFPRKTPDGGAGMSE